MRKLSWLLLCVFISSFATGQTFHNEWIDNSKTYYKFKVGSFGTDAVNGNAIATKGIVRIPYSTIVAAGLAGTPAEQDKAIRLGTIKRRP